MWGRYFGLAVGLALLAEGLLIGRPQMVGALSSADLGPFTPYRMLIAVLAVAVGAAVMIASLLREAGPQKKRVKAAEPVLALADEPHFDPRPGLLPIMAPPAPRAPIEPDDELQPFPAHAHAAAPAPAPVPTPAPVPAPALVHVHVEAQPAFTPAAPAEPEPVFTQVVAPVPAPPPPAPAAPPPDRTAFLQVTDEGHQLRAVGRFDDAFDRYDEALTLARRRTAASVGDPWVRRDLATALTNVGDVHDRDGRLEQAIALHQESLELRRSLAAQHPDDPAVQRSLSLGLERLADARDARGHRSRARDLFRERLGVVERLALHAPADPTLATEVSVTRERLRELDEHLAL